MNRLLSIIGEKYKLKELDSGEFGSMKVSGLKFSLSSFSAEGLGHVSFMEACGFFGLMKMDTLIIVPGDEDRPLYSYDRIKAGKNDTLIIELYDTLLSPFDTTSIRKIKDKFSYLPERDPGKHWYDSLKLEESISKKAKNIPDMERAAEEYLEAYLVTKAEKTKDREEKRKKTEYYVSTLLEKGGPSTDVFKKKFGGEKTRLLFENVLFGTGLR